MSTNVISTLTVVDNRTGKSYDIAVDDNTIKTADLKQIKSNGGKVLRAYDPGYMNTCCCISRVSYVDGDNGLLLYRGYPIEELAHESTFEEVAFLLYFGELPTSNQLSSFCKSLLKYSHVHEDIRRFISNFRHDAHPMSIFAATIAAMGSLYPNSNPSISGQAVYNDRSIRNEQFFRILAQAPVIAALIHRHRSGASVSQQPHGDLGFTANFLYMTDKIGNNSLKRNLKLVKALEILFILHQEHELNCSTAALRHLASSGVDVYTSISAAIGALYGPKHGGANEAVVKMLERIGTCTRIPEFIDRVKRGEERLMGFGHRIYKSYDPRAKIVKVLADTVFNLIGTNELVTIAVELEKVALTDEYFIKRKLYPNIDFFSGLIYKCMGFSPDFFPVLFCVPRMSGWLSHWGETFQTTHVLVRPQQLYKGHTMRHFYRHNNKLVPDEDMILPTTAILAKL
eukprot:GHVR01179667.1.p1 GENE.GHVR01179667.1~~GHVR01179667.1.p1  ORF type:complete len:456 (-),score=42.63 GHVR01179667.1:271-1638(-)